MIRTICIKLISQLTYHKQHPPSIILHVCTSMYNLVCKQCKHELCFNSHHSCRFTHKSLIETLTNLRPHLLAHFNHLWIKENYNVSQVEMSNWWVWLNDWTTEWLTNTFVRALLIELIVHTDVFLFCHKVNYEISWSNTIF